MGNSYTKAITHLESLKSNGSDNFKQLRHKAMNIVDLYGDDEFRSRFGPMVKLRNYDNRSDSEKRQVLMRAIDNAIHFFKIKEEYYSAVNGSDTTGYNPARAKGFTKVIFCILTMLILWLSFVIYNQPGIDWHVSGLQYTLIVIVIALFVFNSIRKQIDDKWLSVVLTALSIIVPLILKALGIDV